VKPFPVFLDLVDRKVVVVGGGRVAERKVHSLLRSRAAVTVISPALTAGLKSLVRRGLVRHLRRRYRSGDLRNAFLAFAATNDPALQRRIAAEANRLRCLVNVADRPELCTFLSPSVLRRGDLTIAISTGGKSPALAKALRRDLGRRIESAYSDFLDLMGFYRHAVTDQIPSPARRKKLWNRLMKAGLLEMIRKGRKAEARKRLAAILEREGIRTGKVG
jgi:precorrin-2 dehydrogenase/sirohydrochlorin ferrochelatase